MNLLNCLDVHSLRIDQRYLPSYTKLPDGELMLVRVGTELQLAAAGSLCQSLEGQPCNGFLLCPTNHRNRLATNALLPDTAPVSLGSAGASFGFGDRLGYANAAQIRAVAKTAVRPVLAQQSLRELQLTGRTLADVLDCAAWAVLREGYRQGYACDGDHLKTLVEVQNAVAQGCTMITLDCSLALHHESSPSDGQTTLFTAVSLSSPQQAAAAALGLSFSQSEQLALHEVYDQTLSLIAAVYQQGILPVGRPIDLEISLDETDEMTTPEAHFFLAAQLAQAGVSVTSIAPRFLGEFQKAIEYIGDLEQLKSTMEIHAKIADFFGHKLSLHSASEKFSVLPILAEVTGGRYHVKTSGTSWLEVVEVIAKHAPALYRRIHEAALAALKEAKCYYVVHCDLRYVAPLDTVPDDQLPSYLLENDGRQLLHITYGFVLKDATLKRDILHFLAVHRSVYEAEAEELYGRHFAALHCAPSGRKGEIG